MARPAPAKAPQNTDPIAGGKLQRVEAYGHVQVRTQTDIVTGDRGVYLPDTGLARVLGHVHITRGENQLNGAAAVVNMKTGLAPLPQAPGGRVQGLVVPHGSGGGGGPPGDREWPGEGRAVIGDNPYLSAKVSVGRQLHDQCGHWRLLVRITPLRGGTVKGSLQ